MADTDPNSSARNVWSTVNGSYRGHIRRKRIVAAVIILLLLAPLTYLVVNQIIQARVQSPDPVSVSAVEVTTTSTLSQGSGVIDTPTLAQFVSVTPRVLPSETATAVRVVDTSTAAAPTTPQPTRTSIQTQIPRLTTTATTSAQNVAASTSTSTPRPTNTLQPTATSIAAAQSVSPTPTATPTAQPTLQIVIPATGGETPGLNLFQILGLILLGMVLILLGSALIAQPARR